MKDLHSKCLVLNADYSPLCVISWRRALVWQSKYENNHNLGIEIIDFYKDDFIIGTNNKKYPIPAVAKTRKYLNIKHHEIKFSRKNIFIRDNFTCQYCEQVFAINDLTYDHLIPKSKWNKQSSPTSWTNIVTSCVPCNRKKGNKTLQQAGMTIKNFPTVPNKSNRFLKIYEHLDTIKDNVPEEWKIYV